MTIENKAERIYLLYNELQRVKSKINIAENNAKFNIPSSLPTKSFLEQEKEKILTKLEVFIK